MRPEAVVSVATVGLKDHMMRRSKHGRIWVRVGCIDRGISLCVCRQEHWTLQLRFRSAIKRGLVNRQEEVSEVIRLFGKLLMSAVQQSRHFRRITMKGHAASDHFLSKPDMKQFAFGSKSRWPA